MVDNTFAELEAGRQSRPRELYLFQYGSDNFRYTSAEENITFDTLEWTSIAISRGNPQLNPAERRSTNMEIRMPFDQDFVTDFQGIQPAKSLTVTVYRLQLDERTGESPVYPPSSTPTTSFAIFTGKVTSIAFRGRNAILRCNPFNENLQRTIPRLKYQNLCKHVLYDGLCQASTAANSQSGVVSSANGNQLVLTGFTGDEFTGGYVQNAAGDDYRSILVQSGDQVTLLLPFASDVTGTTVTAFKGCDHTIQTCRDKFSNVANFGGFPYIPEVNPFEQSAFTKS